MIRVHADGSRRVLSSLVVMAGRDMESSVVVVFRSRMRPGNDDEVGAVGDRMTELASSMPGFIGVKDFLAEDGENLTLVEFDTLEHLAAWRDHPEHRMAQQLGRERFFSEYRIQVCTTVRAYSFRESD